MNDDAWRAEAVFAHALLDPEAATPSDLRAWNGSDPIRRLAVHRNNVVSSLVDALAESFPVVQALVGEEFFRAMASIHVRRSPPRSRVLALYGADFADFIADFEPASGLPYLPDMARLEFARIRAFHAADAAAAQISHVQRAMAAGERASDAALLLHPSLSVLTSAFAVASLWAAHQGAREIEQVDLSVPGGALVFRKHLDVWVLPISDGAAEFFRAALGGESLGGAARAALARDAGFDLTGALSLALFHGLLCDLRLPLDAAT